MYDDMRATGRTITCHHRNLRIGTASIPTERTQDIVFYGKYKVRGCSDASTAFGARVCLSVDVTLG